jgi:broad specificity phosphatase PhoE
MIVLVRHGQTAVNAAGLLQGRADPPLTDLGRRQAGAAAAAVPAGARFVSSPLLRARQTAEIVARGAAVETDERWIELDYGAFDGRAAADVPAEVWDRWRADPDFAPPGGESLRSCAGRVRDACEQLVSETGEGDVVVVSHVSPIKAAVAWALDVGVETSFRMFLDVGAICRVAVGPRGPSLRSYNERPALTP